MNFDRINEQLQKIQTTKKIENIHALVGFLVEPFGITQCNPEELFMHASIQREFSRFVPAQGFHMQAGAYKIPHDSGLPIDIKLFWMKKTTKANLSWVMALTPNYEDNPETNANLNIGIDIVVSENCDSVFIVLSNNLKARVLELNGSLSLTQQKIFTDWIKIGKTINRESEYFKKEFHTLLWKSFDFEPINRKFYLQLVEQFDHLVGHLKKNINEEPAKMFAVRLIGRTLFLWFLRKKEFVNPEFDYFTVSGDADQTQYYREKLEPLFFEVLNTEIKERSFADKVTPFLNGGLFEPIDTDFYKKPELTFPEGFFTQFFGVLNHYNFTVDEGTSEYEQVAVDPEMLGRVFENLLASLNDETGNQARKSKGAFYTPREIVDYMCEQSLIEYLKAKLPDTANRDRRIEELVTMDEASFREQDHNKRRDWKKDLGQEQVVQALDELKILDPAVGSGAFPMGMLNLLVKVYTRIDTAREKDLAQLKRDILSRSLYGVDIDQMAIQISRLRAWLSILVDMESLKKAEPLPNLDFKFVCANTLIPLAGVDTSNLFDEADLKQDLIKIRDAYYSENRKSFKKKLRDQYLERIKDGGLFAELESQRQRQLKDYNPFNPLNSSGFYDPTLMHGVESFGLVIGNPPYVQLQKNGGFLANMFAHLNYETFARTGDIYALFYEQGLEFSKPETGLLCYITSNKWMRAGYGEKLRAYFAKHNPLILLDLGGGVFESATVDSNILLIQNSSNKHATQSLTIKDNKADLYDQVQKDAIVVDFSHSDAWFIGNQLEINLKKKIEEKGVPLKDWDVKINFGIKTGFNDAFIINEEIKNKLIAEDSKSIELIKPILRGRDVKRFYYQSTNNYVLIVKFGAYKYLEKEYFAIFNYLKSFESDLKKRGQCTGSRSGKVVSTDYQGQHHWLELDNNPRDEYINDFEKEKIVWGNISYNSNFSYAEKGVFMLGPGLFLTTINNLNIKLVLGILNSAIFNYLFKKIGISLGTGYEWKKAYLEEVFVPKNLDTNLKDSIIKLVSDILEKKKNNINADTTDLESQIDELVMDLYGLNEEEKKVIRNS